METHPLYYDNPDETSFTARILAHEPAGNGVRLILDQTQFYPEGGGQPADRGNLGGVEVSDVRKEDGRIWHYLARLPESAGNGTVSGEVDRSYRDDFRQQHTGQHILSAAFMKVGNYPTVSVHQGEQTTTIEFGAPEIPQEEIDAAEELANRIVTENRPVRFHRTDPEGLSDFQLRRPTKQTGSIRVVEIEDFDQAACGGVHFSKTGRVGLIKFQGAEKIRGNYRTYWSIGRRAMEDYREKLSVIRELSSLTSTPQEQLPRRIEELLQEGVQKQQALKEAQKRIAALLAQTLIAAAEGTILTAVLQEEASVFKEIAQTLTLQEGLRFCLVNTPEEEGRPAQWALGGGPGTEIPFPALKEKLFPLIAARGGGRPPLWQGAGSSPRGIDEFLEGFKKMV